MTKRQFNLASRITAFVVFAIAAITYLTTIEPTASFWDCGEFIASSFKLEVGHAPGNPVFQILGRFFTILFSATGAARAVNIMSALCSATTILLLYLTVEYFAKKLVLRNFVVPTDTHADTALTKSFASISQTIIIIAASVIGSLAYCWSDTFWFSAVEGEVYAMSSLVTALVFWAMLKWEEQSEEKYANRWIVFIALLMGLSIGIHLLNLLTIPALTFIYYYKKGKTFTFWKGFGLLLLSGLILALILWGIIPLVPKIAAYMDLFFVNVLGLGFNSGAIFFMIVLLVLCFWGLYITYKKSALWNTILLCFTMIIIGYSAFAMVIIRSSANTPTNEYQPDNPFTLVRYLGREQYGTTPLVYGETFDSMPDSYKNSSYYTPLDGKYYKADGAIKYTFPSSQKMLFSRMWSRQPSHIKIYKDYMGNKGRIVSGSSEKLPTMGSNLKFFFNYQINYMYIRYFMWNFVGRQNDIHGQQPSDLVQGNWESGIKFLDKARLGDQSEGPDFLIHNKAKNHYFFLPLILGLLGFFFQLNQDKRNWWVTFLLFLLTGLAIVVYINQPPLQVRERDYAYAGSFYVFSIWIGLSVLFIYNLCHSLIEKKNEKIKIGTSLAISIILLGVPILMACQNWDDHNRSHRYTARDVAYNYLVGCDKNAILITFGDNDTFPLWYIQEVEGIRTDVRIMNTSLLGTDWYIDQMQVKCNESAPIKLTTPRKAYLYGTNEYIDLKDVIKQPILVKEMIRLFNDDRIKALRYNRKVDYIPAKHLRIPVNVENVKKYGIVDPKDYDKIQDTLKIDFPASKNAINKSELIILDMLSNYNWDRPIYFISQAGDLDIGLKKYLQYDGFVYKFVPIQSETTMKKIGQIVPDKMYHKIKDVFKWDNFERKDYFIDYQNLSVFNGIMNLRSIFVFTAEGLYKEGKNVKAIEILDTMQKVVDADRYPLNTTLLYSINEYTVISACELYYKAGAKKQGLQLCKDFADQCIISIKYFSQPYAGVRLISQDDFEMSYHYLRYVLSIMEQYGNKDEANKYITELNNILKISNESE